jgi:spermidine synthase
VTPEVVARAESERGEVVVRRRTDGDGVLELRVNVVFVMDTAETSSERLLARAVLQRVRRPRRILVGGLGLGYTVRELLADDRVERVVVAEIEPAVVGWMRAGVLPGTDVVTDRRVEVVTADVRGVVRQEHPGGYDVVLLDVDNGPDFLVYDANAALYAEPFLARCRRVLTGPGDDGEGGALAVWSSTRSAGLEAAMRGVFRDCDVVPVPVDLQGRDERYWLFTGRMVR